MNQLHPIALRASHESIIQLTHKRVRSRSTATAPRRKCGDPTTYSPVYALGGGHDPDEALFGQEVPAEPLLHQLCYIRKITRVV
jgi:hypothetical protein